MPHTLDSAGRIRTMALLGHGSRAGSSRKEVLVRRRLFHKRLKPCRLSAFWTNATPCAYSRIKQQQTISLVLCLFAYMGASHGADTGFIPIILNLCACLSGKWLISRLARLSSAPYCCCCCCCCFYYWSSCLGAGSTSTSCLHVYPLTIQVLVRALGGD